MAVQNSGTERALILVKALPQPSEKYTETVCVAGITAAGEWRRLYPVRFRHLKDRFQRWQWIEYKWGIPKDDRRKESRNVDGESIHPKGKIPPKERARFLAPRFRLSTDDAYAKGESLTLIRPTETRFTWEEKTSNELESERRAYANAARQSSFFDEDKELRALEPCPYKFFFSYQTADQKLHKNFCHDWETSAAFHKLSKRYGGDQALRHLNEMYNDHYPKAGVAFAMGTHSQRPEQWLLIGVLRLDEEKQTNLGF